MPAASLRALLLQSIDYAGMFPPCSLGLEPALRNQAEYVRSPDSWMLGAFVLSAEQFDATRQHLSQFDAHHPLRVAALGPKTQSADVFLEAVDETDAAIRSLSKHNVDLISMSHLEMFLPATSMSRRWRRRDRCSVICQFSGKRRPIERNKPSHCSPSLTLMLTQRPSVTNCAPAE